MKAKLTPYNPSPILYLHPTVQGDSRFPHLLHAAIQRVDARVVQHLAEQGVRMIGTSLLSDCTNDRGEDDYGGKYIEKQKVILVSRDKKTAETKTKRFSVPVLWGLGRAYEHVQGHVCLPHQEKEDSFGVALTQDIQNIAPEILQTMIKLGSYKNAHDFRTWLFGALFSDLHGAPVWKLRLTVTVMDTDEMIQVRKQIPMFSYFPKSTKFVRQQLENFYNAHPAS